MKKTILLGLIAGIAGLAIGYKVPKDKHVGYVMISGRIKIQNKQVNIFQKLMM